MGLANDITKRLTRPISWVHMPVPKERRDASYYKPLNQLDIGSGRLYLGLVHPFDEEGTRQRILIAQSMFPQQFGIATEYGMGRTSKKEVDSILQTMREVSTEILSLYRSLVASTLLYTEGVCRGLRSCCMNGPSLSSI